MHCMTVSLAANGAGLGTMWGEEKAREMLQEPGFTKIEVKQLPHDLKNAFYIIKKNWEGFRRQLSDLLAISNLDLI